MRTAIINQFFVPDLSPTARLCGSLARHRLQCGDRVTVVTSRCAYVSGVTSAFTLGNENAKLSIYLIRTPLLGKSRLWPRLIEYGVFYLRAAWRMLRLPRQDVVISLTTPPFIAWTAVLHKLLHRRCRIVLWNMDCYPELPERLGMIRAGGLLSLCLRWLNRALFRRLDCLVCLDAAMIELLLDGYVAEGQGLPTALIPNWEERANFPPVPRFERPQKEVCEVLYQGNAGAGHEFDTVMRAAEELRDDPVRFLFVGGGSRWEEITAERDRRQLDNVVMRPYVPKEETLPLMAAADCALITLKDLALGVLSPSKVYASLAAGLPILYVGPVGSNVDEAIVRFECGASVRNGDWERVVSFVRSTMANRERHGQLSRNARRAFDEAYCDEKTLPQFDAVLEGNHVGGGTGPTVGTSLPPAQGVG